MISFAAHAADVLEGVTRFEPYRDDPAQFVADVLGEHLWSKQVAIMESVRDHRHTAVQSGHGVGKSHTAARVAAWWLSVHPAGQAFVVTTAPTFPQVRAILWKHIHRAHTKGRLDGRLNQTEWWLGGELVAMGRKPADYDQSAFQGIHARYVLVIIDEAAGVPASLWNGAEGLVTNEESRVLAIGHPDDPTGRFADACAAWSNLRISVFDSPNFTGEPVPASLTHELVSETWVEERRSQWGEESPLWASRVEGRFPDSAEDAVVPLAWVQAAAVRELPPTQPVEVVADIARFGQDKTVVGVRRGDVFRILSVHGETATTEAAGLVKAAMSEAGATSARIDEVGVGAGVVDMLREQGIPTQGLNGGAKPLDGERYLNARAEWYWQLRKRFEDGTIDIPDDPDLIAQLVALKRQYTSRGQIKIESKEDMRRRGVASPDKADTLMMAFAVNRNILDGPLGV